MQLWLNCVAWTQLNCCINTKQCTVGGREIGIKKTDLICKNLWYGYHAWIAYWDMFVYISLPIFVSVIGRYKEWGKVNAPLQQSNKWG